MMRRLFSLRLYSLLIYCAVPFALAAVLWRGMRDRRHWHAVGERFGWGRRLNSAPSIWLHAVSLGEMSAAAPLVRALLLKYPQYPLVLTTATLTGRARAAALFGDGAEVRFLPYDTPGAVARFLDRIRPRLALIVETELWPNLFAECERRGVPLVLASARLSAKSVARYRRLGNLFRGLFSAVSLVAAQTVEDAERFIAIGAQRARTRVVGNIKFDTSPGAEAIARGRALRNSFGAARPTWIAGSTHAGEEEQVLAAHETLREALPDSLLLLVPRHPDRFEAVAELLSRRQLRFTRRSGVRGGGGVGVGNKGGELGGVGSGGVGVGNKGGEPGGVGSGGGSQVVLVDTVGELESLYASADAAFVGGSLVPIGGHNLLEPAALGLPVLTGPHHFNGKDIARLMLDQGAALQVGNARELAAALARLLADPQERRRIGDIGRHIVESNRGSVARLLELIEPWLPAPAPSPAPAADSEASPAAGC